MIEAYYNYCHQVLGIEMYTIPLIVTAVIAAIVGIVHWRKQKAREEEISENEGL